jgi:hypothetical protein
MTKLQRGNGAMYRRQLAMLGDSSKGVLSPRVEWARAVV